MANISCSIQIIIFLFVLNARFLEKDIKRLGRKLESEINKEVEVPNDFASKVIDSLDKKIKTTTNKGTKIILLSLIGLISLLILVFGIKRSSNETNDIEKD